MQICSCKIDSCVSRAFFAVYVIFIELCIPILIHMFYVRTGDSLPWGGSVSLGNLNLNVAMQKNNGSNGDGSGTPSSRGLSDSQQSVGQRAGRNVDGSWNIGFRGTEDMRESRERTQPEVELKPCITKNKFQRTKDVILLTESARKKISFVDP